MSRGAAATVLALALAASGCASMRTVVAPPDDLADYRAFRVAAVTGTRLARAQAYLERHPRGAFAEEVRAAFDEEEPRYFEQSQVSRAAVSRYLMDLPRGPHAKAAVALLTAFDTKLDEIALDEDARVARLADAKLEEAAQQRRAVASTILAAVGALLEGSTYGVRREDVGKPMRALLAADSPSTWGALPATREHDLYFLLPTRPERESRLLTLVVSLSEVDGVVVAARVHGADMFVRWAEADKIVALDPSQASDRTEAAAHAMERLGGALERRFPEATCKDMRSGPELFHRSCGGWAVVETAGEGAGDEDAILVSRHHAR